MFHQWKIDIYGFFSVYIHYAIDIGAATIQDVVININIGSDDFVRRWKIKTSRIECGSPDR